MSKKKNKFRVAGLAFGGTTFDEVIKSDKSMSDFVDADITELTGGDNYHDLVILWASPRKVIIEGLERLYLIEKL